MTSTRTQVYFSDDQRAALDRIAEERGVPMALVVREAVAEYLEERRDTKAALDATFGSVPNLEVPRRDEADRYRPNESWSAPGHPRRKRSP